MRIYVLKHPATNEIRYVGVTTRTIKERLYGHLYDARKGKQRHVCKWIKSLLDNGLFPLIEQIDDVSTDWEYWEQYYIKFYNETGGNRLTNIDKGGNGVVTKEKRDKSSLERCAEKHCKEIYQLDDELNIIKVWKSKREASYTLNINYSSIGNSQRYGGKAGGYFWCLKSDYNSYEIKTQYSHTNLRKRKTDKDIV